VALLLFPPAFLCEPALLFVVKLSAHRSGRLSGRVRNKCV
jgi:hypothetical protein